MLLVKDLHAYYGRAHILHGVSLEASAGEVVALLGRNGAGKSTVMKTIMGLVSAAKGEVTFDGRRIERLPPYRIARLGLGYVPEDRRIFTELSVMENLAVGLQPPRAGAPSWTEDKLFALFPNLAGMRERPGGRMSGGEQQMLTIARTLMGNPRCVLLDEPSEGLAPIIVEQMARSIHALKGEGLCVLLSEQNLHFSQAVADRAYIIEKGQIRFGGSMAELAADASLREQYLFGVDRTMASRVSSPSASTSAAPSPTFWRSTRAPTPSSSPRCRPPSTTRRSASWRPSPRPTPIPPPCRPWCTARPRPPTRCSSARSPRSG